jgi:hypothetical protein
MTQAIKLHTHLAPKPRLRRLTSEEIKEILARVQQEIDAGEIKLATRLLDEVIEALR